MSKRMAALATSGLVALLLAAYLVGATALFPPASPMAAASGGRTPASTLTPLPEFTREPVIDIAYVANGTAGSSGVFWVELHYRISGSDGWVLYAPPWNPEGRWYGALGFDAAGLAEGSIPFDTYYTGGEAAYEFSTVSVDRGYWIEAGPDRAKARTTLDTRPPNLFIATPTPGAWTREKLLTWVASDAVSGVAGVEVTLDALDPVASPEAEGSLELAISEEGDHVARVIASDRAGNTADVYVPFHFDPNAPSLAITSPVADSYSRQTSVEVAWTAGDSASGIASLRMSVDAGPAVDLAPDAVKHTLTGLAERMHSVTLVVQDLAGNFASQTVTFGVDESAPTLEILAPSDSSFANARDLRVLWLGHDAVSGVERYELTLDSGAVVRLGQSAGYTFPNVPEGSRVVRIVAYDRAGNHAEATTRVTVDVTAPVLTLSKPGAAEVVYGNQVDVAWTASDAGSGIARVEIVVDGRAPLVATGATTHAIESPAGGAHYVIVRAWDKAGNMQETGRAFTYGGSAPPSPGPFDIPTLDFWLAMLLVTAIAIALAYVAVRRRKKTQA